MSKRYVDKESGELTFMSKGYFWRDKCILIVEDIEVNHMLIDRILRKTKCKTEWAMDGEKAVQMCQNNEDIDLVLMYIRLPKKNGYEATKEIRTFRPDLPIIAQTAYVLYEDIEKVLEVGCNDLVTKPIIADVLLEKCRKYLIPDNIE